MMTHAGRVAGWGASAGLLLATLGAAQDAHARAIRDPVTSDHPLWVIPRGQATVDGALTDADWDAALEIFRTQATRHDRAVRIRMMYNDDGLFLSADVEDTHIWADGTGGGAGNRWEVEQDDSVTFYFDPNGSADEYLQSNDFAFGANLGSMSAAVNGSGAVRRWKYVRGDGAGGTHDVVPGGDLTPGMRYASIVRGTVNDSSNTDQGWSIEMFVPWSAIGMSTPTHGHTMGMNFDLIQDNDGGTRNLIDNRDSSDIATRYLQPHFIDDHVQGAHSSYSATLAGVRGPVSYAEVMFVDSRANARPARISDLSVSEVGAYGARLRFTAPAGTTDGRGHASRYDIRYASSPITNDAQWLEARPLPQRYTPRLSGLPERLSIAELSPGQSYYVAVRAVDGAGNYGDISNNVSVTTSVAPAGYRGRVIVAPMGSSLMFENGDPYVVVGDHLGVSWGYTRQLYPGNVWDTVNRVFHNFSTHVPIEGHYSAYFDRLAASGVNTMRVYLELQNVHAAGNPALPDGTYWLENRVGEYNPHMRTFIHNVLREAGNRGIRIIFSPFDSFSYDEAFGTEGPWATRFGGPLTDINNFFQAAATLDIAKARMNKVIQWANESDYRGFVLGWEPLSEWDSYEWTLNAEGNGDPGRETELRRRCQWISALGEHIKRQDPGRLVFNSTITRDPRGPVARQVFVSRSFDALTPHLYTNSNEAPINNPQGDKSVLPALENGYFTSYWISHRADGRPVLNGEWGMTRAAWPGGVPRYSPGFTQAQDEELFRTVIWSGLASGQFGTGLRIAADELAPNYYALTNAMRQYQRALSQFVGDASVRVDLSHLAARNLAGSISASAPGHSILAWGVSDGDQGIAYVLQDGNRASGTVTGGHLVIAGLTRNRMFDAEIWSTSAGTAGPLSAVHNVWSPSGELTLDLPAFDGDLAVKFSARAIAPQTERLVTLGIGNTLATFGLGVDYQPFAYLVDAGTGSASSQDVAAASNFRGQLIDMTAFRTPDGLVHLAATDARSHVWHFAGNLSTGAWTVVDLTAGIDAPGLSGDLTTYQPSWGTLHIAGLDARGHAINYWWASGYGWMYDDLTARAGGPPLRGGLTGYVTGWDGLNLAGLNDTGEVIVYWWAPGLADIVGRDTWLVNNLTREVNGPLFTGQLDAYVTPWGGLNVAGQTAGGEIFAYWWSPQLKYDNLAAGRPDKWEVTSLKAAAGGPSIDQGVKAAVSTDGGINVLGLDSTLDIQLFRWLPGGAWTSTNPTEASGGVAVTFPLAAGSAGNRLVVAGRNADPSDGTLALYSLILDTNRWQYTPTAAFIAP